MENVVFTQLSIAEIRQLFRQELEGYFTTHKPLASKDPDTDELLTVQDAAKFLSLSVPTVYGLISKKELPVMKRSKRCYFSKVELMNYLKQGRQKTHAEIAYDVEVFTNRKPK